MTRAAIFEEGTQPTTSSGVSTFEKSGNVLTTEVLSAMALDVSCLLVVFLAFLGIRGMRAGVAEKKSKTLETEAKGGELLPKAPVRVTAAGAEHRGPKTIAGPRAGGIDATVPKGKVGAGSTLAQVVDGTIAARIPAAKAIAVYKEYYSLGKHKTFDKDLAAAGSSHTPLQFYSALVQCAGRAGKPQVVEELLDDMVEANVERPKSLYESAMRLLAKQKFFKEAVCVYDRLERDGHAPSPVTLSCLVGFLTEIGDVTRALYFFDKLCKEDVPSIRACMTVLRLHAKNNDFDASVALLRTMRERNIAVDSIVLNIVLATGVAAGRFAAVEALLSEEAEASVADVVSLNIIMKGLAQRGEARRAIEVLKTMRQHGIAPNLITVNTAMDAAVRGHRPEDAWNIFDNMKEYNLEPDKCTCSTLVKGLRESATPERVMAILDVVDRVFESCSAALRASLFSGALDAALSIADLALAMRAFRMMVDREIEVPPADLQKLLVASAKAGDTDACSAVWLSASNVAELDEARSSLTPLLARGHRIDSATLLVPKLPW
eukprot:CAMPEP_0117496560 /NCGR_PEP_ID=MMETSP0784-20121206/20720_1 /TAXON_ID=39447 /ORGANISM="" /LENGTH=547 /DNA_ID=CAMNT_0005291535 /DNA_START=108 /DNA_END=1748 /DNA_ORIENTATION=+